MRERQLTPETGSSEASGGRNGDATVLDMIVKAQLRESSTSRTTADLSFSKKVHCCYFSLSRISGRVGYLVVAIPETDRVTPNSPGTCAQI
jgi:hypothetical protein